MSILPFTSIPAEIRTKHLTLRRFLSTDLEAVLAIVCSDKVKATYMLPDFPTREAGVNLFDRLHTLSHSAEHMVLGICLDDTLIGFLNDTGTENSMIEVGYALHPNHWNRGYATEALTAAIDELFRLGFTAVRAGYFEGNSASGRVMEKSGMHPIEYTDTVDYRGKTHRCFYYEINRA